MANSNENISTPVTRALDELGIAYRLFRHPGPIRSLEQAARERGQQPEQVVRSLSFRLEEHEFILALVAGPQQIAWSALVFSMLRGGRKRRKKENHCSKGCYQGKRKPRFY